MGIFDRLNKRLEPALTSEDWMFDVAGVTFEGRQEIIKALAADIRKSVDPRDLYYGMTKKEIKEEFAAVFELEPFKFDVEIRPALYEGENAYEVWTDKGMVGYMPVTAIPKYEQLSEKYNHQKLNGRIIGGKAKMYDVDTEKVVLKELTYGVAVGVHFFGVV